MIRKRFSRRSARIAVSIAIIVVSLSHNVCAWTFGCYADIHNGDAILERGTKGSISVGQAAMFQIMKDAQCEYLLFPGDMVGGMLWLDQTMRTKWAPGGTDEELVLACAELCYGDFFWKPLQYGLKAIYCVGDHELGDNNTPVGSQKAKAMPYFKDGFARAVTLDSQRKSLYNGTIGSVPQRPVGTSYENTSYVFINKNVLFVTLDLTRFDGPNIQLDPSQGAVSWEISGAHAAWFDSVCAAGRRTSGVDFIVVQGHYPAIMPVTHAKSSSCFMKDYDNSVFWKILQKHRVDFYLAGEVHALSSNIDTTYQIIQFVGGGQPSFAVPSRSSFFLFDAADKKITVSVYEAVGSNFQVTGTMVVEKLGITKSITSTGTATPVDRAGILLHYTFDEADASKPFVSRGQYTDHLYLGIPTGITSVQGILDKAASFSQTGSSTIQTSGEEKNPIHGDMARSFSAWVKTTSAAQGTISVMGNDKGNSFALTLNNGVLQAKAEGATLQVASTVPKINDGEWHFVTVTYAGAGAPFESSLFYLDGAPVAKAAASGSTPVETSKQGGVLLGSPFAGVIDDWSVFCGALPAANIKVLYNSVVTSDLKYDAAEMDSIFHIFREQSQGTVQGKTWSYTKGLTGSAGSITKSGAGVYTIVLNGSGEGVTSGTVRVARSTIKAENVRDMYSVRHMADGYHLECSNKAPGGYTARLFGANGKCLRTYAAKAQGLRSSLALERDRRLLPGAYFVTVETVRGSSLMRFVKMPGKH